MRIFYAGQTNKGYIRRNNEDNLFCNGIYLKDINSLIPFKKQGEASFPTVFAVFDGVGGEKNGEVASYLATKVLSEHFVALRNAIIKNLDDQINKLVDEINEKIQEESDKRLNSMGTTMALVIITKQNVISYNIGDSRIYTYKRKNGLRQISVDHTLAQQRILAGVYTAQEAKKCNDWGKLIACLGIPGVNKEIIYQKPTVVPIEEGIRLLLCTDGLSDMISDKMLERILRRIKNTEDAANRLMLKALSKGGKDNISLIVVDIKFC